MWSRLFFLVRILVNRLWFGIPLPLFLAAEGLAILADFFWLWGKPVITLWRRLSGRPGQRFSSGFPQHPAEELRRVLLAGSEVVAGLRRQKKCRLLEVGQYCVW